MKRRAWNSTLPASTTRMSRKPMKRGTRRPRGRKVGRTALAKEYAAKFPNCEICPLLELPSGCTASQVHHVWTPTRWELGDANFVHCCAYSHWEIVEKFSQFGRLMCTVAKIQNGNFKREIVREKWRRDPIDNLHADKDAGKFEPCDWEDLWLFVSERF